MEKKLTFDRIFQNNFVNKQKWSSSPGHWDLPVVGSFYFFLVLPQTLEKGKNILQLTPGAMSLSLLMSLLVTPSSVVAKLVHQCLIFQLYTHVQLFATPWTEALQASLSFTISWSLLKLMSIESVMPSNHLVLYHPLVLLPSIFPSIRWLFTSHGQSIGASDSAPVLPMNIQG